MALPIFLTVPSRSARSDPRKGAGIGLYKSATAADVTENEPTDCTTLREYSGMIEPENPMAAAALIATAIGINIKKGNNPILLSSTRDRNNWNKSAMIPASTL